MDLITRSYAKKLASGIKSITVNSTNDGLLFITNSGTSFDVKLPNFHSHINLTILDKFSYDSTNNLLLYDGKPIVSGSSGTTNYVDLTNKPSINGVELSGNKALNDLGIVNYDDTQVKADISDLDTNKQDKTDNALNTTDKTVVGAINEVNGNQLDTVGFSADYKNIILNRKNGLNPYTIPIASIIHNAKIIELNDIDSTNIGDGKTLIYDATTKKHKYVDSTGTDELVKMDSTTDAKHLSELIDKSTVVNDNGILKVKKLDGQEVTIAEINYLKGLTMNVMDLVNMFANGGVKIINTPINTYADLLAYDKTGLIDGISYLVYVLADETHDNAKTTYLIDKTSSTPTFFGNADSQRNFTTDPIDLANEVTNKLGASNIDVDALWSLLTINDTYKTLTTKDEVFGTHGAKALYDELVTSIGKKANATDLTSHTGDTNIHITTSERTKWNKVDNKIDKTDIVDNLTSTNTDKPLSANQGKILKGEVDNKANDNEVIKKTAITTIINSSSTDTQVSSAKAVYDKILDSKKVIAKSFSDVNNADFIECLNSLTLEGDKIYSLGFDKSCTNLPYKAWWEVIITGCFTEKMCIAKNTWKNEYYLGDLIRDGGVLSLRGGWQKICTTSVADVPVTDIVPADTTTFVNFAGNCNYCVKNGVCYVTIWGVKITSAGGSKQAGVYLPKSANGRVGAIMAGVGDGMCHAFAYILEDGNLFFDVKDANINLYASFSYPVLES